MAFAKWSKKSLRWWVGVGIASSVLPLAASAVLDHFMLAWGVLGPFQSVATRQRHQIDRTQRLRLDLWEVGVPVNEFIDAHEAIQVQTYRSLRVRIEAAFLHLHRELDSDPRLRPLLQRAEEHWNQADRIGTRLTSAPRPVGDARGVELADQFDGFIASSVDELRAVADDLTGAVQGDYDSAVLYYERAQWITGIAAAFSLLAMMFGVVTIGRIMVVNVDRLVDGARRFASGERAHRIDVQVPPELKQVADEFNHMIERIRSSEAALAEEARSDPLTGLANRRAFEENLDGAFARLRRMREPVLLLMVDIDHFKKINDSHGHAAGDEVLRAVGRTLAASVREVDRPFRIGGEEFAVLLAGTDIVGAARAAERLRTAIAARRVAIEHAEVRVTASIGVALANGGTERLELLRAADAALYSAKTAGRNRVVVAPSASRAQAAGDSSQSPT